MKLVKRHLLVAIVLLAAAALLALTALLVPQGYQRNLLLGMSSGIGTVAVLRIAQMLYYRARPEKGTRYAVAQTEERAAFIAGRSALLTLSAACTGMSLAAGILLLSQRSGEAYALLLAACGILLFYCAAWLVFRRKY